ncbi:hypothetical protein CPB84DRAFT_1681939 [Gymnopilus junonius]|uniref:Uncharacterized protein n=1 Tax=Gymnopilus junonius TaxID=109634 RepID=A0A9P5NMR0_GYMJU|nr:hypothetical protein CPB84DRAFT_1681939 [Gymnopilus junonius]
MSEKLDKLYADIMKAHPFGIAMYRPLPSSVFGPGCCGYFDHDGSWNPIVHLMDTESLLRKGLELPDEELERAPVDNGITWGPMVSSNIKATKASISGGVAPATGIPVTAAVVYSYAVDREVGAVLLTSSPVSHEHYIGTTPFTNWCKKNARIILKRWPEIKERSLWIITSTYSTKKCAINLSRSGGRGLQVGFNVDVSAFGQAGSGGEWYRNKMDQGWAEYTTEVSSFATENIAY